MDNKLRSNVMNLYAPIPSRPATRSKSKHTVASSYVAGANATTKHQSNNHFLVGATTKGKRKADASPTKGTAAKRSALGDMTNAHSNVVQQHSTLGTKIVSQAVKALGANKSSAENNVKALIHHNNHHQQQAGNAAKRVAVQVKVLPSVKTVVKPIRPIEGFVPMAPQNKPQTRASLRNVAIVAPNQTAHKPRVEPTNVVAGDTTNATGKVAAAMAITASAAVVPMAVVKVKTRLSHEFEKTTNDTLYSSAMEDLNETKPIGTAEGDGNRKSGITFISKELETKLNFCMGAQVPDGVVDFDKEHWNDVFQISHYAMNIFNYLKSRESFFTVPNYMDKQIHLTKHMRTLLVDWMVDVQESFELNHETLYLGVKLVDLYLSKSIVSKDMLQLVGAAAMFVASKYDERVPPLVEDFLYICDGAYTRKELLRMEISLLKICQFDLGMPLSYRFLRRYARCAKLTMPILTLARFILEYSLMDYATVTVSESKLAAASLYMALRMKQISGWTTTLEYYTGYQFGNFASVVLLLNAQLHKKHREHVVTVRNKYSHKIFYEVAKTPLLTDSDLIRFSVSSNQDAVLPI